MNKSKRLLASMGKTGDAKADDDDSKDLVPSDYCPTVVDKVVPLEVWDRGISLQGMVDLLGAIQAGKLNIPADKKASSPGEEFRFGLIEPRTKKWGISYAELLAWDPKTKNQVGPCTVFVSHAWKYKFEDLVAGIKEFIHGRRI